MKQILGFVVFFITVSLITVRRWLPKLSMQQLGG